jgi:hypothetical protein
VSNSAGTAKAPSRRSGTFATRAASLRTTGTTAPPGFRAPAPSRRAGLVPALLGALALALAATLALGVSPALADTAPTPTTEAATAVAFTTVHVSGHVNPNGGPSTTLWHFQYREASAPEEEGSWVGPNPEQEITPPASEESNPVAVQDVLAGLHPSTAYLVRLLASNEAGANTSISATPFLSFTTKAVTAPELTIASASTLTYHSAHVAGTVELANEDPAFNTSSCAFQYVTDDQFNAPVGGGFESASSVPCEPETVLGTEAQPVEVKADLNGLNPGTTYHLRLVANNLGGNSALQAANFETEAVNPPSASGLSVSALTATSAHFEATVNSGGSGPGEKAGTYQFTCSPSCPGIEATHEFGEALGDGAPHVVSVDATGLEPNTPYTLTITATSPGGLAKAEAPFTTEALAPEASTLPFVGPASSSAARIYGTVNPHNSPTTYFFEYGPADCASNPCASIPATKDAEVPPGNVNATVSQDLTGLSPSTEYHYRIVAKSPAGTTPGSDRTLTTAAAPEACSAAEQQLRAENNSTQLPDCRAWEMVTPAFKAGNRIAVRAVSADGSRLIESSTGAFAGAEGEGLLSGFYQSVRSELGWATSSIDPPSARFPAQELFAASANLTRSLWTSRHPSQSVDAEDFYLREADGSFTEVGPWVPPTSAAGPPAGQSPEFSFNNRLTYSGASSDLSHVFFQIYSQGPKWPGDTTESNTASKTLYEYVGTGNSEPRLVGISDEGSPASIEDSHLISECGSALGSPGPIGSSSIDTYNAISVDGEVVFFTAISLSNCDNASHHAPQVNELYARVGQGPGAHTVAISQPTVADCEACDQAAAKSSAEFAGASDDASTVFFRTTQQLFSGAEGEAADNLYSYDFKAAVGHKVSFVAPELAPSGSSPGGVARVSDDGSHVYFVSNGVLAGANAEGKSPSSEPEADNLYVFERDVAHPSGRTTFIATLSPADSTGFEGVWSGRDSRPVQATPDGRFLVFQSRADLTPGDTSSVPQVFEYDAVRKELARVSVGGTGSLAGQESADTHASAIPLQEFSRTAPSAQAHLAVSEDGSTVLFSSAGALTPGALAASAAGAESTYEYRSAGPISSGDVHLLSDGINTVSGSALGLSASGGDAFFQTLDPLLATDRDTQIDFYDARIGGGFPTPPLTPLCSGESGCRGPASPAPTSPPPATPGFNGPGNSEEKPCKKGLVRKHSKCVKRHSKKHGPKHKRANTNRRGGK